MNDARPLIVAIDGPAGAGKSTIAKGVAAALDIPYLDTGAMYRYVTFVALERELDLDDIDTIHQLCVEVDVSIAHLEPQIRSVEVTAAVSVVAANPGVREVLRDKQREWAAAAGGVMEGRDIGTVVFPDAPVKVFLNASVEERARRRAAEVGRDAKVVEDEMRARDAYDSSRAHAPLTKADDAIEVDTTEMTPTEAIDAIVSLAHEVSHVG